MWATFESMASERKVATDALVSEAMATYARARGYDVPTELPAQQGPEDEELRETNKAPAMSSLDRSYAPIATPADDDLARTLGSLRPAAGRSSSIETTVSRPSVTSPVGNPPHRRPAIASPSGRRLPPLQPPAPRSGDRAPSGSVRAPSRPSRAVPPSEQRSPEPSSGSGSTPSSSRAKELVLTYRGQPHPVEKERFLLGRSKNQADLRLDDGNVSRQHAVIERVGAAWYIVDLGSTNGVHVAGERVVRRALSDGDVIVITTHEIQCSLR
jgi:hypothetical protein